MVGYAGKLDEKQLAFKLRSRGLSYSEIRKRVRVSKSTLSLWCRDVILSPSQLERLKQRKIRGAELGRFIGAKKQQEKRIQITRRLLSEGRKEMGILNDRERFVAGASLYLGDGCKGDRTVGFSNSNPRIIKFMMGWFREFCEVSEEKFRCQIWIHDNLNERKAKLFWSKTTGVVPQNFHKSYIAKNKIDSKKVRKQLHKHGVMSIIVSDRNLQRKILGWMSGILGEPLI